ncbi:MAG: hypothetical protein IH948_06155 [Bacteroidetes bacterium]|nr:hypothetical protein [Bacteroidota bacterium]
MSDDLKKNTGLLLVEQESDFFAGALPYEERVGKGWKEWLPTKELQKIDGFETFGCVSFSHNNCVETQINWMIAQSKLSAKTLTFLDHNGYLFEGLLNVSDRYLAKVSNTSKRGNSCQKVADAGRHFGYVPETLWAFPETKEWNEYYKEIPMEAMKMGKKFLDHFDISYEIIPKSQMKKHLKHAPLQIGSATCPDWHNDEIIQSCDWRPTHATMIYAGDGTYWSDFDHYNNYKKKLVWDYPIPFVMKIVVTPLFPKEQYVSGVDSTSNYDISVYEESNSTYIWLKKKQD